MNLFLKRIFLFTVSAIALYLSIYFLLDKYHNGISILKNDLFIWGDSQAVHGIDLDILSKKTKLQVCLSAHNGSGVYDFLVFCEQVPTESMVLVSLSKLVQVRRKENDYNRSGISFFALKNLSISNYSIKEIKEILFKNNIPRDNFIYKTELAQPRDSILFNPPISRFRDYYRTIPDFLRDKQDLILIGINKLIKKECNIVFIEFPFHDFVSEIENKSDIKAKTDYFKHEVLSLFKESSIDTITLDKKVNIFYDLTHLNSIGARDLTIKLAEKINNFQKAILLIVN